MTYVSTLQIATFNAYGQYGVFSHRPQHKYLNMFFLDTFNLCCHKIIMFGLKIVLNVNIFMGVPVVLMVTSG